jgi:hypothetical protein
MNQKELNKQFDRIGCKGYVCYIAGKSRITLEGEFTIWELSQIVSAMRRNLTALHEEKKNDPPA